MGLYCVFEVDKMRFRETTDLPLSHLNSIPKFVLSQLNLKFILIAYVRILVFKVFVRPFFALTDFRRLIVAHRAHEIIWSVEFVLSWRHLVWNNVGWIHLCHKVLALSLVSFYCPLHSVPLIVNRKWSSRIFFSRLNRQ